MTNPMFPKKEFVERTEKNLLFIEQSLAEHPELKNSIFEVTQLVNSMLGVLIYPDEISAGQDIIEEIPLRCFPDYGLPVIEPTRAATRLLHYKEVTNLRELVHTLRNCFAHFNMEFYAGADGEIGSIKIWNILPDSKKVYPTTWEAYIDIDDFRDFVKAFIRYYLQRL